MVLHAAGDLGRPQPAAWATLVGQAYRLAATANAPSLAGTSLSFSYLGSEVPPGEEQWLKLYFWDGLPGGNCPPSSTPITIWPRRRRRGRASTR